MNIQKYFEMLRNGEEEKARRYREKTIPSKLVKFFYLSDDIDNNEKRFYSLENGQIWFSCVTKLNDPYEFRGMRIDENELFEYGYTKDQVNQFRELLEFNDYGVCCFTANDVNYLPMWAYYSNNHEGFCVEYDVVKPSAIHEVFYEAERIQVGSLINEINIAGRQSLLLGRKTEECNRYLYYLLQNLFIKAKTWQNEKEYRIVYGIDNTIGNNIKLSNVGIKTRRIIAGINCSEENVHRLNSISMKLKCGNASKCILSDKHFGIELQMIK